MNRFRQILVRWLGRLEKSTLREKVLLVLMVLVVAYVAVDMLVVGPRLAQQKMLRERLAAGQSQQEQMLSQLQQMQQQAGVDPDLENRRLLSGLQMDLGELERQLRAQTLELVAPAEMPVILEDMLLRQKGLRLLRMENLPPQPLVAEQGEPGAGQDAGRPNVYRHGLQLEFSGSYREVLAYLQALEGAGRQMFWGTLSVQVEAYPVSRATLTVYTLSLERDWIGV